MTEEANKPKDISRANTYCMNRVNGSLCHNRIPLTEAYCDDCKKLRAGGTPAPVELTASPRRTTDL